MDDEHDHQHGEELGSQTDANADPLHQKGPISEVEKDTTCF